MLPTYLVLTPTSTKTCIQHVSVLHCHCPDSYFGKDLYPTCQSTFFNLISQFFCLTKFEFKNWQQSDQRGVTCVSYRSFAWKVTCLRKKFPMLKMAADIECDSRHTACQMNSQTWPISYKYKHTYALHGRRWWKSLAGAWNIGITHSTFKNKIII